MGGKRVNLPDELIPTRHSSRPSDVRGDVVVMRLTSTTGTATESHGSPRRSEHHVANTNLPTADAGMNQQVQEGALVSLHGTGDDGDEEVRSRSNGTKSVDRRSPSPAGQDVSFTAPVPRRRSKCLP